MTTLGRLISDIGDTLAKVERFKPDAQSIGYTVDVAARVNALRARMEALDEAYKARLWEVKPAALVDGGEIIPGDTFTAVLTVFPFKRIDVVELRETHPRISQRFTIEETHHRVTFKPRG